VAAIMGLVSLTPSLVVAQEISDEWQFGVTVYGWFPDIGGDTRFPAGASSIDVPVETLLDHLKMTFQGSFSVQKGHWGAFADVVYLDVGEAGTRTRNIEIGGVPLPAAVDASLDFDLKSLFVTLAATYRVTSTLDVLLGARMASFKPALDWEFSGSFGPVTPPPLTGSRKETIEQWDAIVGVQGHFAFGPDGHWIVPYHLDVGAGDSDMTWQAMVGVAYAFNWGNLGLAWRYLDYDLGSDASISSMNFNGPALGATFRW
jgi:hypothetical protein